MLTRSAIALPGYQITEQLYAGSRTLVYRAIRQSDQQPVVIKLLKNQHPSFSELVQFRNQYTIAKNLEIPGIVKPYSLELHGNRYALVMEDFGGKSLRHFADGRSLPLTQFLPIALKIVDILHLLHQQRVIHKDIKPANILIQPETQQIKLIDFSISSLLPRETQEIKNPNGLQGTLAYLSPEQTGRMNRGIDYRSDFYSLGVTFYELLTGQLPFPSTDPLEMVHCHLTQHPPLLHSLNAQVPPILSEIVTKLMAKNAEDRYQSALGLKHDLECYLSQWQEKGNLAWFGLGQRDLCDRFLIPERLYGREAEVTELLSAFNRVSAGDSELLLVAGFSGIGKTAVVNEVHKPIVRQRGYFIKGKFDQFQRNIPFSAFVQALRNLMGQLLNESDAQRQDWKSKILNAVGENGKVLLEVIPELEQLIGQQPPVPELSGNAAQNRFNLLLQKFIRVFTIADHPLVLFLDDLQWADSASLNLLKLLMADAIAYLLILGAYRDNEVFPAHPLMLTLADIDKTATLNTITLTALSPVDINQLVADTLSCTVDLAQPLSELVYQKTQGNPFFTTQFLKALHADRLITFDVNVGHWQCDIAQVRSLALTDDVVEFMAIQLQKLPEATQAVLKLAACIGNQFELATLAIVNQRSPETTAADLWKALQEGLLLPSNEIYKFYQANDVKLETQTSTPSPQTCRYRFLHDRVQQAAYSLIPDDQKQLTHLQIGRLLQSPSTECEEDLFTIVNHLNQGASLIEDEPEQQELVQLNLAAGQKAKSATAYAAALNYFNTGISLLKDDRWQDQYNLTLALYEGAANAAYLSTDFEQMEQLAEVVLTQAHSWLDQIDIYETKIQACMAQNQQLEALRLAREVLEPLGVPLPEQPTQADVGQAIQHTQTLLGGRAIESLLELPPMTAVAPKAAMVILSRIISAAYQAAPNLLLLVILAHINLSVQNGNAPESANGYLLFGLIQIAVLKDIETGGRFGQLGMSLSQNIHAPKLTARMVFTFNCLLRHWQDPAKETLAGYLQAYAAGLEGGDLEHAALALTYYDLTAYYSGQELSSLQQEIEEHCKIVQQLRQNTYLYTQRVYYQAIANLLETTAEPDRLHGEHYDEAAAISLLLAANDMTALYCIYFNKLLLSYLFERYEQALENASLADQYLGATAGLIYVPLFSFYDALVHLATYPTVSETEQTSILDRVAAHQENLSEWAVHAPSNQAHRCALVAAERCRVLGQKADAIDLYDRAIDLAKANEYVNEAAIANELAAKFYLEWGKERIAQEYLIDAYYSYARWGAKAKVTDLETRYPQLLAPILQQTRAALSVNETVFALETGNSTSSSSSISDSLDLGTILKASQSLSREIELSKLLSSLLQLILENSGADKCVLMLTRNGFQDNTQSEHLLIKGLAIVGTEPIVLQRIPIEESQDIPLKLIHRVKNCLEAVVVADATTQAELITDPYFSRQQPKSILCSPILHQGKLFGIVYLENNLTIGAFTDDRVHILNLLCAQATISLENARLYQRSQEHAQELEQSLEKLRASEASLAQEREFLNAIIHTITDGIVVCDADGKLILFNKATREFHGLPVEALPPEHWAEHFDLYHSDGKTRLSKLEIPLFRALQGEIVENAEMIIAPRRGATKVLLASGQAIFDPLGSKIGAVVVMRDVSDRKQAEQQLQESQQVLQLVLNTIPHKVFWKDCNLFYQGSNRAFAEVVGFTPPELVGKSDYDLPWTPEESDWFRTYDRRVMESNTPELGIIETTLQADGTTVWIETSKVPLHDATGTVIGILGIYQDISDRKQAEAALQQAFQEKEYQTRLLQTVLDSTQAWIFAKDQNFRYIMVNRSYAEAIGQTVEIMLGKDDLELGFPEELVLGNPQKHLPGFRTDDRRALGGETVHNSHDLAILADGSLRIFDTRKNPLCDLEGNIFAMLGFCNDVTERKQAEEQLRDSEAKFRSIIENAQDVIFMLTPEGNFSYLSPSWQDTLGYDLNATLNQPFAPFIHPDDLPICTDIFMRLLNGETKIVTPEYRVLHSDGNYRWFVSNISSIRDATDKMLYSIGVSRDNTERKQAEQEQARLLAILEATPDIVGMADAAGNNIYLNRAGQQILQIPAEEMNQFHISEVTSASALEMLETEILPTAMREGIWSGESMVCSRGGKEIPVSQVLMTHKNAQGEVELLSTIMRDIRDRRRIEAASKAFQERLTFLIQQTPLGIIEWDLEFQVVGWNPSAERIFGHKAEEMLAQHAIEIIPEADRPHVTKVMQGLVSQQGGYYSLNQNVRKDGELITCEWINTPLLNSEGRAIGIFSIVQDVSDRKQAEQALQQKSQALEDALTDLQQAQLQMIQSEKMSALGNLVAGVAHEINNPIGFISGNLQPALDYIRDAFGLIDLYQQEYPNPSAAIQAQMEAIDLDYVREDLLKLIDSMRLGVDRIRSISTSLRTFSRADKDHKVSFSIHEGIESTILILKHRLKANSVRPAIEVVTNYGQIPAIECFPGQLNQVFMNILANAIDTLEEATQSRTFADSATRPNYIEIRTHLDDAGKQVIIHIQDNGMGMSDEVKQRVFDHLFTTKAVGKGTGLGLAIAYQIVVEKHGGAIEVNSTLGVGTEFAITLPVQANDRK